LVTFRCGGDTIFACGVQQSTRTFTTLDNLNLEVCSAQSGSPPDYLPQGTLAVLQGCASQEFCASNFGDLGSAGLASSADCYCAGMIAGVQQGFGSQIVCPNGQYVESYACYALETECDDSPAFPFLVSVAGSQASCEGVTNWESAIQSNCYDVPNGAIGEEIGGGSS